MQVTVISPEASMFDGEADALGLGDRDLSAVIETLRLAEPVA